MKTLQWLTFLRHYGPVPRNDNMYDETIQRSARRLGIAPIQFEHPIHARIVDCFTKASPDPVSVVLTGTAGDGKTHLCRQVWKTLKGNDDDWASDSPYLSLKFRYPKDRKSWPSSNSPDLFRVLTIHFIRDLSGWAPQQGADWEPEKELILQEFCHSLFNPDADALFLLAANDGQLVESWRRLGQTEGVKRARSVFEDLLVEDRQEQAGVRLKFFNLSRISSAELFDRAIAAFLTHGGWDDLRQAIRTDNDVFGSRCPIRRNYELLKTPLVQSRLRALLELCDHNGLHVPIRQILLLLTNAVLGHPDVKDHLMVPADVPKVIASATVSKASLYNNVFGGNLSELRRQTITIFDYLERFQIGFETTNRVDNLLIFGEGDENLAAYFNEYIAKDEFYGADASYYAAKREYIEGTAESEERGRGFLQMLVSQRRGLFFKIPKEAEEELKLWQLTVFKFAGEYLDSVVDVLRKNGIVKRPILSRLVKGLNRVFTGMFINSDRELYLATSGNYSQAKVSRILLERVSVDASKGEKIILRFDHSNSRVLLSVYFTPDVVVDFTLTLIRFEFLSRISSEGALPASFSKECYEDLLALKSQLIAGYMKREEQEQQKPGSTIGLNLLALTDQGMPDPRFVEIVR
jgi:hypothetical protein